MSLTFAVRGQAGALHVEAAGSLPVNGVTVLFGPSGAGKSTFLRMVAGLLPCEGMMRFGDQFWQRDNTSDALAVWQRPVGMLLQQPTLFRHLSVQGNLDYVRKRRPDSGDVEAIVRETRIGHLLNRSVDKLSGGEAQRVALARALMGKPELLLLDEPLSAVDLPHRESLLSMIQGIARSVPVLYVTHSLDELLMLADQVWLMEQGRIISQGPVSETLASLCGPLSQRNDATALLFGECGDYDPVDHLQPVQVGLATFQVPLAEPRQNGAPVRLRIAARDVSLCRVLPAQSSILNIIETRVEDLAPIGAGQHLVKLSLQSQTLLARLSSRSVRELNITVGERVFAQVKAVALV